jgi:hypothetical protein
MKIDTTTHAQTQVHTAFALWWFIFINNNVHFLLATAFAYQTHTHEINAYEDILETYNAEAMKAGQEALEAAQQQAKLEVVAVLAQVVHELVE